MNYKKGDTVRLNDNGILRSAVVTKDGVDSKGRVRLIPSGFLLAISVSTEVNTNVYIMN